MEPLQSTNIKKKVQLIGATMQLDELGPRPVTIFNIYIRPRATQQETELCLKFIERYAREDPKSSGGNSRIIIVGDVNACSAYWAPMINVMENTESSDLHYNNIKRTRGRRLERLIKDMKLTCANQPNQGPTFQQLGRSAHIDVALLGNKISRRLEGLELANISATAAHKGILVSLRGGNPTSSNVNNITQYKTKLNFDKIDERHFIAFRANTTKLITNWLNLPKDCIERRLDSIAQQLYTTLIQVQEHISAKIRVNKQLRHHSNQHKNQAMILKAIRKLKLQETKVLRLKRCPISTNNQYNSASHQIKLRAATQKLLRYRQSTIQMTTTDNNSSGKNTWQQIDNALLRNPENETIRTIRLSAQEDQESWRMDHNVTTQCSTQLNITQQSDIEQLAATKFPELQRLSPERIEGDIELKLAKPIIITIEQFDNAIKELRSKNYTSPQGINFQTFNKSIPYIHDILFQVAKMSFHTLKLPKICNLTTGTIIPKSKPGTFRIVHVSGPLTSLLEQIALHLLEHRLETNRLYSRYQFGFMAGRSRQDLLARVLELTCKHKRRNPKARPTIVSLDISGAFDNVQQDKLIAKLLNETAPDSIGYWVSQFILSREIQIKYNHLISRTRKVCMGVPQGSALGPILWNYVINRLDSKVNDEETELLKYADDLVIVHTGSEPTNIQNKLNIITRELENIKLKICPSKCSSMQLWPTKPTVATSNHTTTELHIEGVPIQKVQKTKILGTIISDKLKLVRNDPELLCKIATNTKQLQRLNQLGAIKSNLQWRIIIDSMLTSIITQNSLPMMAIERGLTDWADRTMCKCLKIVFNWPHSTSNKLIHLILGLKPARIYAKKQLIKRLATEHNDSYETLLYIMEHGLRVTETTNTISQLCRRDRNVQAPGQDVFNTNTNFKISRNLGANMIHIRRRYHNPSLIIKDKLRTATLTNTAELTMGPIWILNESNQLSSISEITGLQVNEIFRAKHGLYPTSYYNSISLMMDHVKNKAVHNRRWAVTERNGLYQAIANTRNHDWKVIQLREDLIKNDWEIVRMAEEEMKLAKFVILQTITQKTRTEPGQPTDSNPGDTHQQEDHCELTLEQNIANNAQHAVMHPIKTLSEPKIYEHWMHNQRIKQLRAEELIEKASQHTQITKILDTNNEDWQLIPPQELSGQSMLMLGGMIKETDGRLTKETRRKCRHCLEDLRGTGNIESQLLTHIALSCVRFNESRMQIMRSIRGTSIHTNNISSHELSNAIRHRQKRKTLLRHLTNVAFNNILPDEALVNMDGHQTSNI